MPTPWFRFYSETLTDRKIDRVWRATDQPKALIIGVWTTLLALANDSPVRGVLLLTEDIPYTVGDLAGETGIEPDMTKAIVREFHKFAMMDTDGAGIMYVTNWNGRQFASDHSAERVQRFRAKKRALQDEQCNGDVTLQGGYSNVPEQSRTESEAKQSRAESDQTTAEGNASAAVAALESFGMGEPEKVMGETRLSPAQVIETVQYAVQANANRPAGKRKLGPGWLRTQLRENQAHRPRAPDDGSDRRRYIEGPHADIIES